MNEVQTRIHNWIAEHRNEMMETWKELVDCKSHVSNRAEGEVLLGKLETIFRMLGFETKVVESCESNTPTLVGTLGADRPGKPVLFSGHFDTVDLTGDHPFRIDEEGHVRGLGCLDMKGGIVITIYVIRALQAVSWAERPIRILFAGDEEKGHHGGRADRTIEEEAAGALCAFNMETGLVSNKICIGRKGTAFAYIKATGVAAHSGNDFPSGRNAIAEIAAKIPKIQALTDLEAGTTVSCDLINGGTVINGIPGECTLGLDCRYKKLSERDRVKNALQAITEEVLIDGCTSTLDFDEYMPPYETNDEVVRLADFVSGVSEELGFGPMGQASLGGGSDASHIGIAGVPFICSMGVRGEFNHTAKEYALPESLPERTELLSNVVYRIAAFETNSL